MRACSVVLLAVGCHTVPPTEPCAEPPPATELAEPTPATRPSPPVVPPAAPVEVAWIPASWPELGLGFASFPAGPVDKTRWPQGGVASQGIQRGSDERVRWLLRTEPAESLASFRSEHGDWRIAESTTTVCGQRAVQLVATREAQHITCVITTTGNHPAWIPPRRVTAVEFTHRGVPVVVSFETESEHGDAWRDVETQFFAAIRCL